MAAHPLTAATRSRRLARGGSTQLDGRGRPDIITAATGGNAPAVTSYDYDLRGALVGVTLPDPSQNNAATVTYTYGSDSIGRPTSMRRPAVGGPVASGLDLTYNGLVHTRTEVMGSQLGVAASTDLHHDRFGRLIEVREFTGPQTYATTTYQFDANDNVRHILNPDGVVTELFHDMGSRRTRIVRAERTWTYGYMPGGQLAWERAPAPPGAEATYINSYTYDELGREKTRNVGARDLAPADATLFGVGQTTFTYDTCVNGVGKLCQAAAPGSVLTTNLTYDAEGNPATDSSTFRFAGVNGTKTNKFSYGPGGRLVSQTYADNTTASNGTVATFEYDARALPMTVGLALGGARHNRVSSACSNRLGDGSSGNQSPVRLVR